MTPPLSTVSMSRQMTGDVVTALLTDLGATADEVAAALQAQGVQGIRNTARFLNPVVRYLQTQNREDHLTLDVILRDQVRLSFGDGKQEEVSIPGPVLQFLKAFNGGAYPELQLPQRRN